jgi:hypothetical protein
MNGGLYKASFLQPQRGIMSVLGKQTGRAHTKSKGQADAVVTELLDRLATLAKDRDRWRKRAKRCEDGRTKSTTPKRRTSLPSELERGPISGIPRAKLAKRSVGRAKSKVRGKAGGTKKATTGRKAAAKRGKRGR